MGALRSFPDQEPTGSESPTARKKSVSKFSIHRVSRARRACLGLVNGVLSVTMVLSGLAMAPAASAAVAPVGNGFTVTPSDLAFILKQIKLAEFHVANTTSLTGP